MNNYAITWQKDYFEYIGEEDQDGFLAYAYCYFVYIFQLPDKSEIKIRQYTDEMERCNLFISADKFKKLPGHELLEIACIAAVTNFMCVTKGVKQCYYFNGGYELLDLRAVKCEFAAYSFIEISIR